MQWYQHLYLGESIKHFKRIKRRITRGSVTVQIFLIAFASNSEDLLDIIPANLLLQKGYPKDRLRIIGLAKGQDEAIEVVRGIIEETYENTGGVDVRKYLKELQRSTT